MSEDFIQVQPDSTGKKLRSIKRTVSGNEVHEEAIQVIDPASGNPVDLRVPRIRTISGAFVAAMHRNLGASGMTVPFHVWAFLNPTGSGKIVYIRRLRFETTVSTSYTVVTSITNIAQYTLYRATAISGGVDRSSEIEKKDTGFAAAPVAVLFTRETAAQATINATLGQAVRRGLAQAWGWGHQAEMFAALPDPEVNDEFVLREGEGLVLQNINFQVSLGYFCTLEWEEA